MLVNVFSNFAHLNTHMFTILFATAVLHLPSVFDLPYGELLGLSSLGLVLYFMLHGKDLFDRELR